MSEEVRAARRLVRPSWRDPRLGVGILLVAGSVALGTWAVRDASVTERVYVARETLLPGTVLSEEALRVVEARPPDGVYLDVPGGVPDGAVATRVVEAGEMVPRAALGRAAEVDLRPVVVPVGAALPAQLQPGAVVDLWFTAEPSITVADTTRAEPELLAEGLLLAAVVEQDGVLAGTGLAVEVLVPTAGVADVLAALAQDGELVVVPVPGGTTGGEV